MFISQVEAEISNFIGGSDSVLDDADIISLELPEWRFYHCTSNVVLSMSAHKTISRIMKNRVAETKNLIKETN